MARRISVLFFSLIFAAGLFYCGVVSARDMLAESLAAHRLPENYGQGIPILMYHKVNPDPRVGGYGLRVSPRVFEKQMRYLRANGYRAVSLEDVAAHFEKNRQLPKRPVVITFDDGYLDNYTYAFPILKKYDMTATIFVVADTIGGINEFDYRAGRQPLNRMAGWNEIKEMADSGITIGAHTLSHPRLGEIDLNDARREIAGSKIRLEQGLGRPVTTFCYPYGSFNQSVAQLVRESGFVAAVTTVQGLGRHEDGIYTLNRIRVRGDYSQEKFLYELTRHYQKGVPPAGGLVAKAGRGNVKAAGQTALREGF